MAGSKFVDGGCNLWHGQFSLNGRGKPKWKRNHKNVNGELWPNEYSYMFISMPELFVILLTCSLIQTNFLLHLANSSNQILHFGYFNI
jgi:hypothetical protein